MHIFTILKYSGTDLGDLKSLELLPTELLRSYWIKINFYIDPARPREKSIKNYDPTTVAELLIFWASRHEKEAKEIFLQALKECHEHLRCIEIPKHRFKQ